MSTIRVPLSFSGALTGGQPTLRVTLTYAEPLTDGNAVIRASFVYAEPLTGGNPRLRIPLTFVEALIPVPEELPVATDIFPALIGRAWDIKKNPRYLTTTRGVSSGREIRNAFYEDPIWEFELVYDFLSDEGLAYGYPYSDLRELQGFFKRQKGKYGAWLYRDVDDYHSVSEAIGAGDGVTLQWPIIRDFGGDAEPVGQIDLSALATFAAAAVNTGTDAITAAAHGLVQGQGPLWLTNSGGALPTPLVAATAYWAIVVDANTFKLASSAANAGSGTAINLTAAGSGTNTLTKGMAVYLNGALQGPSVWSLTLPNQLVFVSAPAGGQAITADFDFWFVCRFMDDITDASQFASKLWELGKLDFQSVIQ